MFQEVDRDKNNSPISSVQVQIISYDMQDLLDRLSGPLKGDDPQVVARLKEAYLAPPSALPYNLSTDPKYLEYAHYGTWTVIHFYLEQIFRDEQGGFFVEAGALDGQHLSNTLWLEQNLNWTGLLVEPNKNSYGHLLSKHRRAWTSNTCLSTENHPKETVMANLKLKKSYKGVAWDHKGASHEVGVTVATKIFSTFYESSEESYSVVQCFPLITYLLALNVSTIDLLSLDMQGGDKQVLRNFPWDKIKVRVVVAEISDEFIDHDFIDYMKSKGFTLVFSDHKNIIEDQIYIRTDEKSLAHLDELFFDD